MTIEQGNKILAEYLQLNNWESDKGTEYINPVLACATTHLAFHESWGWLMQVLEKISEEVHPDYFQYCPDSERVPYEDTAWPRTFGMRDEEGNYMVRFNACPLHKGKTLIEAVWLACVDFVLNYKP